VGRWRLSMSGCRGAASRTPTTRTRRKPPSRICRLLKQRSNWIRPTPTSVVPARFSTTPRTQRCRSSIASRPAPTSAMLRGLLVKSSTSFSMQAVHQRSNPTSPFSGFRGTFRRSPITRSCIRRPRSSYTAACSVDWSRTRFCTDFLCDLRVLCGSVMKGAPPMKISTWMSSALATVLAIVASASPARAEVLEKSAKVSGVTVQYKVVLPNGYDSTKAYPGIIALGGGPQTMNTVDGVLNRNFRVEAEQRGYIVVAPAAPNGQLFFESGARIFPEFLKMILADYKIQDGKFHVAGPSNGGIAAFHGAAATLDSLLARRAR